jgi:hypothetical protein
MGRTKMKELIFNRKSSIVHLQFVGLQIFAFCFLIFTLAFNIQFTISNLQFPCPDLLILRFPACNLVQLCAILCNFVRAFYRYIYLSFVQKKCKNSVFGPKSKVWPEKYAFFFFPQIIKKKPINFLRFPYVFTAEERLNT